MTNFGINTSVTHLGYACAFRLLPILCLIQSFYKIIFLVILKRNVCLQIEATQKKKKLNSYPFLRSTIYNVMFYMTFINLRYSLLDIFFFTFNWMYSRIYLNYFSPLHTAIVFFYFFLCYFF